MARLRIAVGGIHIESSTFSPLHSTAADFVTTRGDELLSRYPWYVMSDRPWAADVDWVPLLHARALPGGAVVEADYAGWREEILAGLRAAGPVDGVLLDIHGAMSVVGRQDVEGDLAQAIREVVGPRAFISTAMDLHGNISPTLFRACDLLTCYRTAPHVDVAETRERAARLLVEALRRGTRPYKAMVAVPILLPGERTSTRTEPARSLYERLAEAEKRTGVLDAAIWIGYAWADEARCHGAVVVTGTEPEATRDLAAELGEAFWSVRDEFRFVAPTDTMDGCLEAASSAIAAGRKPYLISDSGDNPGAGGVGDVTYALSRMVGRSDLAEPPTRAVYASLVDPAAVAACVAAGLGARLTVRVGGRLDATAPGPLTVSGEVAALTEDPDGGTSAALQVGAVAVIVTSRRTQYATLDRFRRLGLDPHSLDLLVVKIGYLEPELYELARGWQLALTPGGVDQDIERLPYRNLSRPVFPLDRDFCPDLTPVVS